MTVYSKILSSQCNLTAEIEPVQDSMHISHPENNNTIAHIEIRQTMQCPKDKKIKMTNNDLLNSTPKTED